jgi:hypothetical protein
VCPFFASQSDAAGVDVLLQRHADAIVASGRFCTALRARPGVDALPAIFGVASKHALAAKLVQYGHASAKTVKQLQEAVGGMTDLASDEEEICEEERLKPSQIRAMTPQQIAAALRTTCAVVLRGCRHVEFEAGLRLRVEGAYVLLQRYLYEYSNAVMEQLEKYLTTSNEM